ncbi:hypothetical protein R1sor_005189 [Riccia sorocarpa]|uniref:Uncharacterized protein n=1 Tax=Riccia sorocarpa TaxID=122646 RepID=A0ABD3HJB9_9MARC
MEKLRCVDVLDFYKNASTDVQESMILTFAKNPSGYSYWNYDVATGVIFVDSLMELRYACDAEAQRRSIWLAILTGLPKKLVVETCYSFAFEYYGRRVQEEAELDDPTVKTWMLQVIPNDERFKGFPVEFVFNPSMSNDLEEHEVEAMSEDFSFDADDIKSM